jgi:hypothetical protein
MKLLLTIFITLNIALAEDVKVVKKGDEVPFDGVLFPKEKEREIRTEIEIANKEVITLKKLNDLNEKEIDILNKRLDIYQKKSIELIKLEEEKKENDLLKNTLYFISGAVLTGVIGYGVLQAYR